jgi:hypothetical protein
MFALKLLLSDKLIGSVARHAGSAAGAGLLAVGLADADTALAVGGAITTLGAFALSLGRKFTVG